MASNNINNNITSKFKSGLIIVCFHLNQETHRKRIFYFFVPFLKRIKLCSLLLPSIHFPCELNTVYFPVFYYWSWWLHNKYWYITLKMPKKKTEKKIVSISIQFIWDIFFASLPFSHSHTHTHSLVFYFFLHFLFQFTNLTKFSIETEIKKAKDFFFVSNSNKAIFNGFKNKIEWSLREFGIVEIMRTENRDFAPSKVFFLIILIIYGILSIHKYFIWEGRKYMPAHLECCCFIKIEHESFKRNNKMK